MGFLLAVTVIVLFASYAIIKNVRGSAERGEGPDISNPSSAPDHIGDSSEDGGGDSGE